MKKYNFMFIVIIALGNVAADLNYNVNVSSGGVDSAKCSNCLTLQYALTTWAYYMSSTDDNNLVNFFVENSQNKIENASLFQVVIPEWTVFHIYGRCANGTNIYCSHGISLIFTTEYYYSSLYFDSVSITGCGTYPRKGIVIENFENVGFHKVDVYQIFGLHLLNTERLNVSQSSFSDSAVTPYAILSSSYDKNKITYATTVLIENTKFSGNAEVSDYAPILGSSGLIALNFFDLIKTNAYIFNVSLVVRNCQFINNRLPLYGSSTQFLQVNGAERHSISMLVDGCLFYNNIFSLSFKLAYTNQSSCFVHITNNQFIKNTSPKIDYGVIHVSIAGISNRTDFLYSNNTFRSNTGACLVVKSESASNHTIVNTTLCDHNLLVDDISPSYLLYVSGHKQETAYSTSVHINNLNATNNRINSHLSNGMVSLNAIASFVEVEFYGSNMVFVQNSFVTTLSFTSIQGVLLGHNVFELNQAMYGGAISIWEVAASSKPLPQVINTTVDTSVHFINNYADYGGAVYISSQSFMQSLANTESCQGSFVFSRNHARVAGQSLYTSSSTLSTEDMHCFNLTNRDEVATSPYNLSISPSSLTVFPGQSIYLNVSLTDGLNRSSSCLSSVKLYCDLSSFTLCEQIDSGIQLLGPPSLFFFGRSISMDTQLQISLSHYEQHNQTTLPIPKLRFACSQPHTIQNNDQFTSVSIVIHPQCPFGFVYNEQAHVCECQTIDDGGENFRCSVNRGKACVRKSYWVGSAGDDNVTAHCPYPRCKLSDTPCPLEFATEFVSLPDNADDQCLPNRGGILCSQCSTGSFPTFEGVRCTKNCKSAYPYIIVLLGVLFQVVLVVLILTVLRLKVEVGSGFLYGPVLFLAIAGELPFGFYAEFETLRVFLSGFKSIFLVNLELFGEIPWCFGKGLNQLDSFMFHYLGPILVWMMLIALVFIGRCQPKLLQVIQDSPVQAISMLIILSFWSVVYTSIMVLLPVQLQGETRIYIQPGAKYLHSWHILCVASSVVILLVVVAPFLLLLVMAQFSRLWRRIRLYRIQPLLDELQSCYQDRYRWYAVVYFITWIVILACKQSTLAIEVILIFLLSLHFFLQPYKLHFLNVIDMLLLLDLLLLVTIMDTYSIITKSMTVIVYLLVGLPLMYIVIGCSAIVSYRCWKRPVFRERCVACLCCKCMQQRLVDREYHSKNIQDVISEDDFVVSRSYIQVDREPLIRELQEDEEDTEYVKGKPFYTN